MMCIFRFLSVLFSPPTTVNDDYSHDLERCYLIGGTFGGERHWIRDAPGHDVVAFGDEIYIRHVHHGLGGKRVLYVHENLNDRNVFDLLLEWYCEREGATGNE